jgi:hypothetical protein
MKTALLVAVIALTSAISPVYATVNLSFSGTANWTPGTSIVLSVTDSYANFGGSYGSSFWLQVNTSLAPFLTITGLAFHPPWGGYSGPFPILFNSASGSDPGFTSETVDLGAGSQNLVPDGSYLIEDITFALAAGAPAGTYTLRTTTASPRGSIQVTSDFNDAPIPQASFVFNVVPEPSTLALIGLTGLGAGVMAYRRRK